MPLYESTTFIRVTGPDKAQKYFKIDEKAEAVALAKKYDEETKRRKRSKIRKASTIESGRRRFDTDCGVAGISMGIDPPRSETGRWYAYLTAQIIDAGGNNVTRRRRVRKDDIDGAFSSLLKFTRDAKDLKRIPKHWTTKNPPTIARFNKIRRQMRRAGYMVDSDFLN